RVLLTLPWSALPQENQPESQLGLHSGEGGNEKPQAESRKVSPYDCGSEAPAFESDHSRDRNYERRLDNSGSAAGADQSGGLTPVAFLIIVFSNPATAIRPSDLQAFPTASDCSRNIAA